MKNNKSDNVFKSISIIKSSLGEKLVIPCHHYQDELVVKIADLLGDSYRLAVDCTKSKAKYILFCGVRFMAEGAAILSQSDQKVILPDLSSGCPLAEMINLEQAEATFEEIARRINKIPVPVVYINSTAELKSFCGTHNGSTCTSSNVDKIIKFFLNRGQKIFFAPDRNLALNSANKLGLKPDEYIVIDENTEFTEEINRYKLFIWNGFCYVHKKFGLENAERLRQRYEKINLIVHPESDPEVVKAADFSGSTQTIFQIVKEAPQGSIWGIGTESTFVNRIANEFPDKKIIPFTDSPCLDMQKIKPASIMECLKAIISFETENGDLKNQVEIPEYLRKNARKALRLMIRITED